MLHAAELKKLEKQMKARVQEKDDEKLKLQNKCDAELKRSMTCAAEMKKAQSEAKTVTAALAKYKAEAANSMAKATGSASVKSQSVAAHHELEKLVNESKSQKVVIAKFEKDLALKALALQQAMKDFDKQKAQACTTLEHEMEIRKSLLLTEKTNTKKARDSLALETQNLAAKLLELGIAMKQNENLATSVVKLQDLFAAAVPGYFSINLIHFIVRNVDSVISISLHSFQDKS